MAEYLFGSDNSPGEGWRVEANTETEALRRLFLYFAIDDPFGRLIRLHHIESSMFVIESAERVVDVSALLGDWGH